MLEGLELARKIAELILEKKGQDVIIQDLRKVTSMTDFFVICSVDVDVQAKAIMDHIKDQLIFQSIKPWHTEGNSRSSWILLDFVDVVVHIFKQESRFFYGLERLWGDAQVIEIREENDTAGTHTSSSQKGI
ncbi:ribosome silencing factor [candidate division KSB1 bacterium]|nr:ribosome silencing factor [candidate division KSB1 bacterium]RQW00234.1 MAG: ribosome silencing factor [candidate division KSB1 bacterium]